MFELDKFCFEEDTQRWWIRLPSYDIELIVPESVNGPDESAFPLAELALRDLGKLQTQANSFISQFVEKERIGLHDSATIDGLSCGFHANRITVELCFDEDVYVAWFVTFRRDTSNTWHPEVLNRKYF